ncbi:hypothetical protein DNJ95_18130 [Stutzerimonas kirkiae]|uniref:Uncharacterized protein n=1 Tax=Stutzerimonas kirkiae TaxID=2211392 RepID=A0A4V2KDB2_9GAMM|nr:hypothetical protein [Stutzerimonas kirkiae]TBU98387.1 hypothetical protein DNJ96_06290 [Stutzerimonas kirkiae]TBU98470.1 hypothetical protein DNJ95_18130 [Stutzerimonas kirkiae]
MMCLGSAFDGSGQVHFFEEKITLSARKPGNLNLLMVEPRDARANSDEAKLSLDNLSDCLDTGDY